MKPKLAISEKQLVKEWYASVKNNSECINCAETNPLLLQFHHRVPSIKTDNVSSLGRKGSLRKFKKELNKCDVLCSACHTLVHEFWSRHPHLIPKKDGIRKLRDKFNEQRVYEGIQFGRQDLYSPILRTRLPMLGTDPSVRYHPNGIVPDSHVLRAEKS